MNIRLILIFSMILFSLNTKAQQAEHHDHEHHSNEIGIGNTAVYFLKENLFAYGLHIHYARGIADTKFGWGIGYERIFDEHKHNSIGPEASYRPIEELVFTLSPGIVFEDKNSTKIFALHLETSYEFVVGSFHMGPVFETAFDREDVHLSFGLHVGYGF